MKVKFKLPADDFAILKQLSEEQDRTMMDVVRHGIHTVAWMRKEVLAGKRFLIEDSGGKRWNLITNVV